MKRMIACAAAGLLAAGVCGCVAKNVDVAPRAPELTAEQKEQRRQEKQQLTAELGRQNQINAELERRRDDLRRQVEAKKNAGGR
jgi:hypothetical protein